MHTVGLTYMTMRTALGVFSEPQLCAAVGDVLGLPLDHCFTRHLCNAGAQLHRLHIIATVCASPPHARDHSTFVPYPPVRWQLTGKAKLIATSTRVIARLGFTGDLLHHKRAH